MTKAKQFLVAHVSDFRTEVLSDIDTEELFLLWDDPKRFSDIVLCRFYEFMDATKADEEIDRREAMAEERIGGRND